MIIEISYELQFLNGNHIYGKINCKIGQDIQNIKKKIIQFQDIKNENSFKLINTAATLDYKVSEKLKELKFREEREKGFGSVVSVRSRKMSEESMFQEASILIQDNQDENFIQKQPLMPPKVCGYVTFPNSFFFCFSSRKYLVLDSQSLKFYDNQRSQYAYKQILPQEIQQIKSYKRKHFYCIRIILRDEEINMKFINKDVCKQWVGYMNQLVHFSHYLKQKRAYSKQQSFNKYVQTILKSQKNLDSTNIVKLQDDQQTVILSVHANNPCQGSFKRSYKNILKLSSFQISHKIDSGSFSTIYLANKNNMQLALKQMNKDKLLYKGQMKYALTQLNVLIKSRPCPYIIPIYYAFQTHEYLYLALKYIPNGNLAHLIKTREKLTEKQAIVLIAQLVQAIQFLHQNKILYRDLKPQNILLDKDGHLYLTDFGLAKQLDEQQVEAHSFLGTPLYLAPQRFNGNGMGIDYRSDIYAVGIILFQMLHGYHPFQADNFNSVIYNIKNTDIEIDQTLSNLTKDFLQVTLQKNPQKRIKKMSSHGLFKSLDSRKLKRRQHQGIILQQSQVRHTVQINYQIDVDYNEQNYPDKKITNWNYDYQQIN